MKAALAHSGPGTEYQRSERGVDSDVLVKGVGKVLRKGWFSLGGMGVMRKIICY